METAENRNIVIVAHKFLTQPDDELVFYLNGKKYENVLYICHSFSDASDRCSWYAWYRKGNVYKKYKTGDYKNLPEPLVYLKELFFTFKWILQSDITWDTYVGMDGLCILFGNLLRGLGKISKTVYWAMDFVPEKRFDRILKNKIYHWINKSGYINSDEMWDLSPRMAEAREKLLGIKKTDYKFHRIVPYGAWTERIKKYSYDECDKNTLVFMGHLVEKQGVQLIIEALPEIIEKMLGFKFKIIGDGKYKDVLVDLARDLNVLRYCEFKGKMEKTEELEDEIAKSCLAIAPYIRKLDTWTYYADPGKIKTYLACGVPVLLTDIPWNAKEIEKNKCGKIISEEKSDIVLKISELTAKEKNEECRKNAIEYSATFDYENIFKDLFK